MDDAAKVSAPVEAKKIEEVEAPVEDCRVLDVPTCKTTPDCALCSMDIPWANVSFCTSEASAALLPPGELDKLPIHSFTYARQKITTIQRLV